MPAAVKAFFSGDYPAGQSLIAYGMATVGDRAYRAVLGDDRHPFVTIEPAIAWPAARFDAGLKCVQKTFIRNGTTGAGSRGRVGRNAEKQQERDRAQPTSWHCSLSHQVICCLQTWTMIPRVAD